MTDSAEATDWAAVKADYDDRVLSVVAILKRYKISRISLERRAASENWTRRTPPRHVGRASLISRLFKVLERQLARLEKKMVENAMADPDDKEVALLGNLTRNLEKLMDLEQKEKGTSGARETHTDIDALRSKLAQRIEQLKRS